jgi:hypothetical protein
MAAASAALVISFSWGCWWASVIGFPAVLRAHVQITLNSGSLNQPGAPSKHFRADCGVKLFCCVCHYLLFNLFICEKFGHG